ncbi:MAG: hypothetical protein ACKOB6_02305 [Candidatus Kapaibacterium sp.]
MKTTFAFALLITVAVTFMATLCTPSIIHADTPTWTGKVACIVYSHCTGCHNTNGIAPFSLMTYNDVYQRRESVAHAIEDGHMPPFPADQSKRRYAHANTLSADEIEGVTSWVNGGAPLGDANNVPVPPTYSSAYQLPDPDFVGRIPTYTVTSDKDVYRVFVIPMNNAGQLTVQSIEVTPGNREIVHHALVFHDTSDAPYKKDLQDPLPGYSAFGGTGSASSKLLYGYTPGQGAFRFAPGFGTVILPKSYLILQVHYPGGVSGQSDSTEVRIKYGPSTLRNVTTVAALNHSTTLTNGPLFIPANTVKTFYSKVKNTVDRTITGLMPHMHLIGRSIKAFFVTPKKDTVHLVDIPEWDFHWQYVYQFQKPVLIPAGSVVYGEAVYDNTENNPHNPNSPPKDVSRGEGTEDEMFLVYMNLSDFVPGDTAIVIDTANHIRHDAACFLTTEVVEHPWERMRDADPCPSRDLVRFDAPDGYVMVGLGGGVVRSDKAPTTQMDIRDLASGVYFIHTGTSVVRVVKE